MNNQPFSELFDVKGMNVVVTGGAGVLCSTLAAALVSLGANVAVFDLRIEGAEAAVEKFPKDAGSGRSIAVECDVLQKDSIQRASEIVLEEFGYIDGLINGAGGNNTRATTSESLLFFDLSPESLRLVFDLNLVGTILPSQVIGKQMAERKQGVILNISSMNAFRPLTRIPAYSAAKAGVSNFTQWLATHMAMEYSPHIRVNAIAPGFFLTDQNRFLMKDKESGELTKRGRQVIDHTPMDRFGVPDDLVGTMLWLMSPASSFVTGIVVPVDGGFSAYSGV
jgi:NAD(P)-dependent dehydrogenase (short-subunit alcohol dehydrogenase family)